MVHIYAYKILLYINSTPKLFSAYKMVSANLLSSFVVSITVNFSVPPSMAHQLSLIFYLLVLVVLNLCSSAKQQVSAELVMEEGYTVSTLFDGNKLSNRINPSSVLPRFSGTHDLLILDTPSSAFYTIKLPISQDSEINRLSGNGSAGFSDGDLSSAMFDRPRSFAVDLKGNVYVADKNNHVIRKISNSGVTTTIAGAYSGKPGRVDGAAQNASFSEDFELVFVPQLCALLISDRGNRLVRQLTLKPEDCASSSRQQQQLGLAWVSLLGVLCLLVGLVVGFSAHPFLVSRKVADNHLFNVTWKHCQTNLEKKVLIVCSDIKSAVASSTAYSLMGKLVGLSISHLSLMFSLLRVEKQSLYRDPAPFCDSYGACRHESTKSEVLIDQLKDLITFDEELDSSQLMNEAFTQGKQDDGSQVLTCSNNRRIDSMIQSNIMNFDEQVRQRDPLEGSLMGSSGLVNRKKQT